MNSFVLFFRFHTYVVSYGICFSLTYFIKHSIILVPTLLLQMENFILYYGWVIFHFMCIYMYICVYINFLRHLLKPVICWWVLVLLLCLGDYKWCCYKHWGVCSKEYFQQTSLNWHIHILQKTIKEHICICIIHQNWPCAGP